MGLTNDQKRAEGLYYLQYLTDNDLIDEIKKRGYKVVGMGIKKLAKELKEHPEKFLYEQ
jgi:hypothetical protein